MRDSASSSYETALVCGHAAKIFHCKSQSEKRSWFYIKRLQNGEPIATFELHSMLVLVKRLGVTGLIKNFLIYYTYCWFVNDKIHGNRRLIELHFGSKLQLWAIFSFWVTVCAKPACHPRTQIAYFDRQRSSAITEKQRLSNVSTGDCQLHCICHKWCWTDLHYSCQANCVIDGVNFLNA